MSAHKVILAAVDVLWESGATPNNVVEELAVALASVAMSSKPAGISWDEMKGIVMGELELARQVLEEDQANG